MGLVAGQWVSNPDETLIFAEGWAEFVPPEPPTPEPEPQTEPGMDEVVMAVKKMLATSVEDLSDEDAIAVAALFPTWISMMDKEVKVGERYWYDERLWKVLLDHTVQESWKPDVSPSLFVEVTIEEWPEWVAPTGSTDAYNKGDKVTHNNQHWVSDYDANIWEPGVFGWLLAD